jgi:hypothetical protein
VVTAGAVTVAAVLNVASLPLTVPPSLVATTRKW